MRDRLRAAAAFAPAAGPAHAGGAHTGEGMVLKVEYEGVMVRFRGPAVKTWKYQVLQFLT